MRIIFFLGFIVAMILAAAFFVIWAVCQKIANFSDWAYAFFAAIMEASFDCATLPKIKSSNND